MAKIAVMFTRPRFPLSNSAACAALLLSSCCPAAFAGPVFATWSSTFAGTLDGVGFTVSGSSRSLLITEDLSGSPFSANPGSASQQSLSYADSSTLTVTFASPIATLDVYDYSWYPQALGTGPLATYDFSQSISILSGNSSATVAGGTNLDATSGSFLSGIVQLTNVTSFTITPSITGDLNPQALDFAGSAGAAAPEPDTFALITLGAAAVLIRRRHLRRGRMPCGGGASARSPRLRAAF